MPKPRKKSKIKPLKTLRIFCEGAKTEPNYLKGYIACLDSAARKSVIEVEKTRKNTAVQLVKEAIAFKSSPNSLPEDEFWVVYDRESVAKYSEELHANAFSEAERNGINVALCNVCFEYWILIHFVDTDAPYSSYDNLKNESVLFPETKKVFKSEYEKSTRNIFDLLKERLADARARAMRLNARGKANAKDGRQKPYQINPYVGFVDLLDAIDKFK